MKTLQPGTLSVVTVSYYSEGFLPGFLNSVEKTTSGSAPIVVVNNAPDDSALAEVLHGYGSVKRVEAGKNLGYGKAMNVGVAESPPSEWLLLANPDLTFSPGAIAALVAVGASNDDIGAVGPLIYTAGGEIYPSARRLPSLRNGIGHALFSRVWKGNPWTRSYLSDRENPPRERDAGWLSGACLLVRRTAFEEINGFDDKFFMYFEDVDLCARLAKGGWRNVYAPSATITHIGAHSTRSVNRAMIKIHHESAYKYLAARYRAWYLAPLRFALHVGLRLRARVTRS